MKPLCEAKPPNKCRFSCYYESVTFKLVKIYLETTKLAFCHSLKCAIRMQYTLLPILHAAPSLASERER
jgi:hypothetical protein